MLQHRFLNSVACALICIAMPIQAQINPGSTASSASAGMTTPNTTTTFGSNLSNADANSAATSLKLAATPQMRANTGDSADPVPASQPVHHATRKMAQTSQFQQFVQEATGKKLGFFGADLFQSADIFGADAALPPPADYVLGPGDEVRVQIWGAVDYNGTHVLDRNGQISLPKIGVVVLNGVPVRNIEAVLRSHIAKVFTNVEINANLGRLRSIQVYVVGQAQQPGTYKISSLSTLLNALFVSGGPSANGSMRNIQLKRSGRIVTNLDLYDFIAKGDKAKDVPLQSGDVIVIPPVGARVALSGAIDQAAIYELKTGASSVADILNLHGGVPTLANTRRALLERIAPEKNPQRQVQDLNLDAEGLKLQLRDGDVITLLGISPAFGNAVTLQGTVAAPLRYRWFEGMRILDLIPEKAALITSDYYRRMNALVQMSDVSKSAGGAIANRVNGLADQINWEYAVIERLNKDQLTTELLPFNLGKAVLQKDAAHNLLLQPGDIVTILSQTDLSLPQDRQTRLVRVEGEVAAPGIYQTKPGESLTQLLERLGGVTPQAYLFGMEFTRESVRQRQQENLAQLIRRMERQLQSQSSAVIYNIRSENASQAQAIQAQQQEQVRLQIERMKTLRSNGRISLELDPQIKAISALPSLPLEDGDRIFVPAQPSFVAAYGSVNNENVFIFKQGKTVGDVIKSAGLTEDAEASQMFILRADGSLVARRDSGGWFGSAGFESTSLMPGDAVVVPSQIDRESRYNFLTRALKDWTQIFANFGLGVAAIRSINK